MTEDLLDACARIYVDTFNSEPWMDAWEVPTARRRLADIFHTPGFFGMAILQDGQLRGAAFGHIEQWYQGSMYCLKEMFVEDRMRGKGLGGTLLRCMELELKPLGVHTAHLFTSKGDRTEGFYRNNGYEPQDDMLMMAKELI
jgi:GNAT superfamily N-acetyltransferase